MGFAELLKGSDVTKSDVDEFADVIERNSTHLLRIIDDILDLSKVEAGKMLIEHIDFSLDDLLADFSNIMNFRAKDKGIKYELKIADSVPESINSDPTRLRQVLTNVVGNAIKFTDHGQVVLAVDTVAEQLRFTVADTGAGLSPQQAAGLFQPFHQADVSTTRKFGGTGLGLVLARSLSEALGGKFYLENSELGKGSTFVATIQISNPKFGAARSLASRTKKTIAPSEAGFQSEKLEELAGMKILIVEDSEDTQVLFSRVLSLSGASVDIAENGHEGIAMATSNAYDVVLMDIQMPVMDGHQASKALRTLGYQGAIIALTAHAMNEERDRARDSGFTDFLSKPVQRDLLIDMLKKFVPN
jgi:CheY-like chemotaxis protein